MPRPMSPQKCQDQKRRLRKLRRISEETASPPSSGRSSAMVGMEEISRRIKLLQAARDLPAEHYLNSQITPLRATTTTTTTHSDYFDSPTKSTRRKDSHQPSKSSSQTFLSESGRVATLVPNTSRVHLRRDSSLADQISEQTLHLDRSHSTSHLDDDDTLQASDTQSHHHSKSSEDAPTTAEVDVIADLSKVQVATAVDSADESTLFHDFDSHDTASYRVQSIKSPKKPAVTITPVRTSFDSDHAPAPLDLSQRGIHIPSRTSSKAHSLKKLLPSTRSMRSKKSRRTRDSTPTGIPDAPGSPRTARSFADSNFSYETAQSAVDAWSRKSPYHVLRDRPLPPTVSQDDIEPVLEDDPQSFDLVTPRRKSVKAEFSFEKRADQLFSRAHLEAIFADTALLKQFTTFLTANRPSSVPMLVYYLDAIKSIRAINYANAVAEALEPIEGFGFTDHPARPTINSVLEDKARQAFDVMVREDLPAYVTHVFIQIASRAIEGRITGTMPPNMRGTTEGLAEVFCLSDPSRPDNPIVFASEEFHRTTQYGTSYIGHNCRFLQGPRTSPDSLARLRKAIKAGKEISEVILNYRRDGSPFMNLLMLAPLCDSKGTLRYFIGAQIDISTLVKDCTELDALKKVVAREDSGIDKAADKCEFRELTQMFNDTEMDVVRQFGGRMHHHIDSPTDMDSWRPHQHQQRSSRIHLSDMPISRPAPPSSPSSDRPIHGKLEGAYQNLLLLRPYPSLRILFTSPSLRIPGILQSPFLIRIGGSARIRSQLTHALEAGNSVTAKIKWLTNPAHSPTEGRTRWIHCTPLFNAQGKIGSWVVLLIDDGSSANSSKRHSRFKDAPPVEADIRVSNSKRSSVHKNDGIVPVLSNPDPATYRSSKDVAASEMQSPQTYCLANDASNMTTPLVTPNVEHFPAPPTGTHLHTRQISSKTPTRPEFADRAMPPPPPPLSSRADGNKAPVTSPRPTTAGALDPSSAGLSTSHQAHHHLKISPSLLSLESLPTLSTFSSARASRRASLDSVEGEVDVVSLHPQVQTVKTAIPKVVERPRTRGRDSLEVEGRKGAEVAGNGGHSRQASLRVVTGETATATVVGGSSIADAGRKSGSGNEADGEAEMDDVEEGFEPIGMEATR